MSFVVEFKLYFSKASGKSPTPTNSHVHSSGNGWEAARGEESEVTPSIKSVIKYDFSSFDEVDTDEDDKENEDDLYNSQNEIFQHGMESGLSTSQGADIVLKSDNNGNTTAKKVNNPFVQRSTVGLALDGGKMSMTERVPKSKLTSPDNFKLNNKAKKLEQNESTNKTKPLIADVSAVASDGHKGMNGVTEKVQAKQINAENDSTKIHVISPPNVLKEDEKNSREAHRISLIEKMRSIYG